MIVAYLMPANAVNACRTTSAPDLPFCTEVREAAPVVLALRSVLGRVPVNAESGAPSGGLLAVVFVRLLPGVRGREATSVQLTVLGIEDGQLGQDLRATIRHLQASHSTASAPWKRSLPQW
jgi:hypothetical protein